MVAHRARVALRRVPPAAEPQLGRGTCGGRAEAECAGRRERELRLLAPLDAGELPLGQHLEHGVQVVHVERAGHVGAAEAELARRQERVGERVGRAHLEGGPAAVRRGKRGAVPEPHRERPVGQGLVELTE